MRATWVVLLSACGRFGFDEGLVPGDGSTNGDTTPIAASYRKSIVIDPGRVTSALTDFPIAVRIVDPDLRSVAEGGKLATGVDLQFLDGNEQPLAFEIDRLTPGDLLAWVKVPVVLATQETRLYVVFGDPAVTTSQENPAGVWTHNFVGVWHLSEMSYAGVAGEVIDSVGAHAGTGEATVTTIGTGQLGRAAVFGGCTRITIPASPSLQPSSITVSAWARPDDIGVTERIDTIVAQDIWRAPGTSSEGYYLELYRNVSMPRATFYTANGPQIAHAFGTTDLASDEWHHLLGTYDPATGASRVYLDGVQEGLASMAPGPLAYVANDVEIGCNGNGSWVGAIDEVRIVNTARSAAWIAAERANQLDPQTFATIGPTEPLF